jgi:hypothetical protein
VSLHSLRATAESATGPTDVSWAHNSHDPVFGFGGRRACDCLDEDWAQIRAGRYADPRWDGHFLTGAKAFIWSAAHFCCSCASISVARVASWRSASDELGSIP